MGRVVRESVSEEAAAFMGGFLCPAAIALSDLRHTRSYVTLPAASP
jgi:hypothetical protein